MTVHVIFVGGNLNRMQSSALLGENGTAGTFAQNSKLNGEFDCIVFT